MIAVISCNKAATMPIGTLFPVASIYIAAERFETMPTALIPRGYVVVATLGKFDE